MTHQFDKDEEIGSSLRAMFDADNSRGTPRREALREILASLPAVRANRPLSYDRYRIAFGMSALAMACALSIVLVIATHAPSLSDAAPVVATVSGANPDDAISDDLTAIDAQLAGLQNDTDVTDQAFVQF